MTLSASCGRRSKPTPPSSSPRSRRKHRQSLMPVPAPGRAQLAAVQQGYSFFCLPSFFCPPSFVCLLLSFVCFLSCDCLLLAAFCLLSFSHLLFAFFWPSSVCLLLATFHLPSFGHHLLTTFWPPYFDCLLLATFCLPLATFFGPSFFGHHLLAFFWLPSVHLHLAALAGRLLFTAFFSLPSLTTIWPSFLQVLLPIFFVFS